MTGVQTCALPISLLTLFVIPVAYTLLTGKLRHADEDEASPAVPIREPAPAGVGRGRIEPNLGAPAEGHVSMRREDM